MGDAVADAAGAADHQHRLPLKSSSFIAALLFALIWPLPAVVDLLRIGASLVNLHPAANSVSEIPWPNLKQLSRSVKGLTVLVTGAASGMGRATAHVFAAEGANVAVTDLNADGTRAVADAITATGGTAKAWTLDVADPAATYRVVNDVAAHFGSLDIVINNAGMSLRVAIDDDGYDAAWAKALAVMLTAHPRIIRAALPYLRRSKCPRIVNIASTEALGATATAQPLLRRRKAASPA